MRVQKIMIFKLNDEPIVGIKSAEYGSNTQNVSIALNFSSQKRKREINLGLLHDAILLAKTFKKSIGRLAKALVTG